MPKCMLINLYKPSDRGGFVPPLGVLHLVSALEQANFPVEFKDFQLELFENQCSPVSVADAVDQSIDVIGISCMADYLPFTVLTVMELKRRRPELFIMLGGAGPSGVERQLMEEFPAIDLIARGEGEETIVEIMTCLTQSGRKELKKINGIMFREDGSVITTAPRSRNRKIDALPPPAYHHVDLSRYEGVNIATGRGCTFRCSFCSTSPYWKHRNKSRCLDQVIEEIVLLNRQHNIKQFDISDDTFTLNSHRVSDFCRKLKAEGLDIRWNCYSRVNLLNEIMLEHMADAGCKCIYIGTDSGSDSILEKVEKKVNVEEIARVLNFARDFAYIKTHFIWGFPFESLQDFQLTIMFSNYLRELGISTFLTPLIPLPLSRLFNEYKREIDYNLETSYSKFKVLCSHRDIYNLVESYPGCFPMFYSFNTPQRRQKLEIVKQKQWLYPFGKAV